MSDTSIDVPLFTRASDRNILDCAFRWHADQQQLGTGASWYAIGTALHSTYERILKQQPKRLSTAKRWAREYMEAEITAIPADSLWSRSRPPEEIYDLAEVLVTNFWEDVYTKAYTADLHVEWGWAEMQYDLERVVSIENTHPNWYFTGGAETTIDCVVWLDGRFMVLDWKTGRSRSSDPRQLQFYRYALEVLGFEARKDYPWGAFYHAEHRTWQVVEDYDPQDVERMIGESQVLKQVRHPEPTPTWVCDYCTVRPYCPAFAGTANLEEQLQLRVEAGIKNYRFLLNPSEKGN